jgi:hypothetical protein
VIDSTGTGGEIHPVAIARPRRERAAALCSISATGTLMLGPPSPSSAEENAALVADFFGIVRRRGRLFGTERYPRTCLAPTAGFLHTNKHVFSRSDCVAPIWRNSDIRRLNCAVFFEISASTCSRQAAANNGHRSQQTCQLLHTSILHPHNVSADSGARRC